MLYKKLLLTLIFAIYFVSTTTDAQGLPVSTASGESEEDPSTTMSGSDSDSASSDASGESGSDSISDADSDGIADSIDNDDDNDGIPDSQDSDDDNDGIPDSQEDDDSDGIVNGEDSDDDGNGIPDSQEEDEEEDKCIGIPETTCAKQHDSDDGSPTCGFNTVTQVCETVVSRNRLRGNTFDDGFVAAQKEATQTSQQLNTIIGVLGGIIGALLVVMLVGGYYFYKQIKVSSTNQVHRAVEMIDNEDVEANGTH